MRFSPALSNAIFRSMALSYGVAPVIITKKNMNLNLGIIRISTEQTLTVHRSERNTVYLYIFYRSYNTIHLTD